MATILAQPEFSSAVGGFFKRRPQLLIDGKWVDSVGGGRIATVDPSSGAVVAELVDATAEDVDRAVKAARRAFDDGRWSNLAPAKREAALRRHNGPALSVS